MASVPVASPQIMERFAPRLWLRRLPVDTHHEGVAYLPRRSIIYSPGESQALAKVEVRADDRRVIVVLNVIDDDGILAPEVDLSQQGFQEFGMPEGTAVAVVQATRPESVEAVRRKFQRRRLDTGNGLIDPTARVEGPRWLRRR